MCQAGRTAQHKCNKEYTMVKERYGYLMHACSLETSSVTS